jgi:hypothetical protein
MKDGFYYLHTNGDLIYKRFEPESDSPFVRKVWALDVTDRAQAWTIALEALVMGADINRVKELADKWGLTLNDSFEFMAREASTPILKKGLVLFAEKILGMSEDEYWIALKQIAAEKKKEADDYEYEKSLLHG